MQFGNKSINVADSLIGISSKILVTLKGYDFYKSSEQGSKQAKLSWMQQCAKQGKLTRGWL